MKTNEFTHFLDAKENGLTTKHLLDTMQVMRYNELMSLPHGQIASEWLEKCWRTPDMTDMDFINMLLKWPLMDRLFKALSVSIESSLVSGMSIEDAEKLFLKQVKDKGLGIWSN